MRRRIFLHILCRAREKWTSSTKCALLPLLCCICDCDVGSASLLTGNAPRRQRTPTKGSAAGLIRDVGEGSGRQETRGGSQSGDCSSPSSLERFFGIGWCAAFACSSKSASSAFDPSSPRIGSRPLATASVFRETRCATLPAFFTLRCVALRRCKPQYLLLNMVCTLK